MSFDLGYPRLYRPRFLRRLHLWVGAMLLGWTMAASASGREGKVALTFDDLPGLTIATDQAYVDRFNIALLGGLRRHRFPATGFVNAGKLDELERDRQIADLQGWLDGRMVLGNHTYSHDSPNAIGASAYIADIARGEPVLRTLLSARGETLRWFRHPYLETGYPARAKREIDGWLAFHDYRVAPVTIDADDWEFAEPYDDAIARHDRRLQRRIMRSYLSYTASRIDWAQRSARILFGRNIAQVMLLHCTRLNADALDRLAYLLRRAKLRPVSLADAMRDPAYKTPDRYAGKDGLNWLERWSKSFRTKRLPERGDDDPPRWIARAYDRVDNDRHRNTRHP
ncbi:MAG: polysaccharide deacetylase family protein [Sphingomonas sp.]|uniref:polysaccharide deacetylase family protein n=1 Tax=Sphingomonas sp. TaxID=28214 RepID=UPI003F7F3767